ncbi:MAG: hypothetical protein ACP5IO_01100 [Elusimicrobiales bacterium]
MLWIIKRENKGDIIVADEYVISKEMNFILKNARRLVYVAVDKQIFQIEHRRKREYLVEMVSKAKLPTIYSEFT